MTLRSPDALTTHSATLDDAVVVDLIQRERPDSFDEFVCALPGVYPADARDTVLRMMSRNLLMPEVGTRLLTRKTVASEPYRHPLPPPHPLDFDWRFSPDAVSLLIDQIERGSEGGPVVLLGAPSVWIELKSRGLQPAALLDSGTHVRSFDDQESTDWPVYRLDVLRDPLPNLEARVVLLDPPWYREHIHSFLWAASQVGLEDSVVLMPFPARGTRPGVSEELNAVVSFADSLGLVLLQNVPGAVPYLSPPFEQASLETVGLPDLPRDWRRGDLLVFRLASRRNVGRPPCSIREEWDEFAFGAARLRVRRSPPSTRDPRLLKLVPHNILPSVSSRLALRSRVDVWTTCNRVFACQDTPSLSKLLAVHREGELRERAHERVQPPDRKLQRIVEQQIDTLIGLELEDLKRFGWAA